MRTSRVLRWDDGPEDRTGLELVPINCQCGEEAGVPMAFPPQSLIIAVLGGGGIVFDNPQYEPPANWMPTEIQCRRCRRILVSKKAKEESDGSPNVG